VKLNVDWTMFAERAKKRRMKKIHRCPKIAVWALVSLTVVAVTGAALLSGAVVGPESVDRLVRSAWLGDRVDAVGRDQYSIYDYIHSFKTGLSETEERELASLIYFESMKYGYDPEFILAIIQTESAFNPEAVSNVGAYGLMQLMPTTAIEIAHEVKIPYEGKSTLSQPDLNVRMGTYYLFKMMLRFKDVRLALVAYNCGPAFVDEMVRRGNKLPEEYVDRVMGNYEKIKTMGM
jgi:soluble lytic murein transglycosylase-like protein